VPVTIPTALTAIDDEDRDDGAASARRTGGRPATGHTDGVGVAFPGRFQARDRPL